MIVKLWNMGGAEKRNGQGHIAGSTGEPGRAGRRAPVGFLPILSGRGNLNMMRMYKGLWVARIVASLAGLRKTVGAGGRHEPHNDMGAWR